MIGNDEIMEMLFPKYIRVIIVLISILAIIGGITVMKEFMQFIVK